MKCQCINILILVGLQVLLFGTFAKASDCKIEIVVNNSRADSLRIYKVDVSLTQASIRPSHIIDNYEYELKKELSAGRAKIVFSAEKNDFFSLGYFAKPKNGYPYYKPFFNFYSVTSRKVNIQVETDTITFRGNGAPAFEIQYLIWDRWEKLKLYLQRQRSGYKGVPYVARQDSLFAEYEQIARMQLNLLEQYRFKIPKILNGNLLTDIVSNFKATLADILIMNSRVYLKEIYKDSIQLRDALAKLVIIYKKYITRLDTYLSEFTVSPVFTNTFIFSKWKMLEVQSILSNTDVINLIEIQKPILRDKIFCAFLLNTRFSIQNFDSVLSFVFFSTKDTSSRKQLVRYFGNLISATPVDDFEVLNMSNGVSRFSDFKGKILVLDFWFNGCSACIDYFQKVLKPLEEIYDTSKVMFLSVSIEKDKNKWLQNIKDGLYTNCKSVNLYTGEIAFSHPIIKYFGIQSYPHPVLIDQAGRIKSTDHGKLRDRKALQLEIDQLLQKSY